MPEAAYDSRRPNASALRQDSRVRTIWRLYRTTPFPDLGTVPSGPFDALTSVQSGIRRARNFVRGLDIPAARGRGRLIKEIRSSLLLHDLAMETDVRSSFTYVRDGKPGENFFIDMPFRNAKGVTHVRLSGRTFRGPISVNGVKVDGQAALNEFEKLFEDYLFPQVGTPADYRLYWVNLDAPTSAEDPFGASEWWIHPPRRAVRKTKSVGKPFDWFWSIEFLALQSNRDVARAEDGFLAGLFGLGALRALLERVGLGSIIDGIQQVFGVIDEFRGLIDDVTAVVTSVTDYVAGIGQFIRMSVAKVRGVLGSIQELIARVEDGIAQVRNLPNLLVDEIALIRQSFPGLVEDETDGHLLNEELRNVRDMLAGVVAQPQAFAALVNGSPILPQTVTIRIQPGTAIERLAQESRTGIEAIIEANNLEYPFIDSRERPQVRIDRLTAERAGFVAVDMARASQGLPPQHAEAIAQADTLILEATAAATENPPLPNVLYAGDPVQLPQERPELVPSIVGIAGEKLNLVAAVTGAVVTEEERLLGIDLSLTERGDLEWDADRVDLRVVRGLDNIKAALARYMALPLGALRFAPDIGNFAFEDLSKWQTHAETRSLAMSIHQTLSQDPRVRRINGIRAVTQGGRTMLTFDATLIDGRYVPDLRVPAEAA